jgi:hypothetical protein
MRILLITVLALPLVPLLAQSQNPAGTVTAATAEFKIPLQRPANDIWTWNRADTPENANEFLWSVTAKSGTAQYSFGFFLYKSPGSREARGRLNDLLEAGQNSVFKEDAEGRGELLPDAKVEITVENEANNEAILVRITNPELVRLIFRDRPGTVDIHSRTPAANFAIVRVTYRDE